MDDWEALADAELNDIKVEKADKFKEEEDLNLKKDTEEKKEESYSQEQPKANPPPKKKAPKKEAKKEQPSQNPQKEKSKIKGEEMSKLSDIKNTLDLFEDFVDPEKLKEAQKEAESKAQAKQVKLRTDADYVNFAVQVALQISEAGKASLIKEFMNELLSSVYDNLNSSDYDDILRKCTVLYNSKQKDEKPKTTKKKKEKPMLNVSKRTDNMAQYNDLMGEDYEETRQNEDFDDGDFM